MFSFPSKDTHERPVERTAHEAENAVWVRVEYGKNVPDRGRHGHVWLLVRREMIDAGS